jgi:hypothetical protein
MAAAASRALGEAALAATGVPAASPAPGRGGRGGVRGSAASPSACRSAGLCSAAPLPRSPVQGSGFRV